MPGIRRLFNAANFSAHLAFEDESFLVVTMCLIMRPRESNHDKEKTESFVGLYF